MNGEGGVRRRRYGEIDARYELVESALMKGFVVTVLAVGFLGILGIAYRELGEDVNALWLAGAVVLLGMIFLRLVTHPATRRSWPTLLANRHSVFFIASRSTEEFLEVPWRYVQSAKPGQYGVNVRGIEFSIAKAGLTEEDEQELWRLPSVTDAGDCLLVAVPSGTRNRSRVMDALRSLAPHPLTRRVR